MELISLFSAIDTFIFDMDGVLTDGSLQICTNSDMLRTMNIKDGFALRTAADKGYSIWIVSGGTSEAMRLRLSNLGITKVFFSVNNKKEFLLQHFPGLRVDNAHILYMGDDIPDLAAMKLCGLPCCPADAATEIRQASLYTSPFAGGKGCVRDVVEKVLKLQGNWDLPE